MDVSRRQLLTGMAALATYSALPGKPLWAALSGPARALAFENLHTGESLKLTYWEKGAYVPGALKEINHILRDYRNGEVARIDPTLLDVLVLIQQKLETKEAFQVISGYRSPITNAKLKKAGRGVATKSLHMEGKAIDIRVADKKLAYVHKAALGLKAGGVGYYAGSNFVHVDTGRVRQWVG